jgi:hypothetical protein
MIEVNRQLYMDEQSGRKTRGFDEVHAAVGRLIESVVETSRINPGG